MPGANKAADPERLAGTETVHGSGPGPSGRATGAAPGAAGHLAGNRGVAIASGNAEATRRR